MSNYIKQYDHTKLFSDHIKRLRKYAHISQEKLAQYANLSNKTIQNIEECSTDPRLSSIVPICSTLRLDPRLFILPELLADNPYESEFAMLISDCNDVEASAILSAAKNVKAAMRSAQTKLE